MDRESGRCAQGGCIRQRGHPHPELRPCPRAEGSTSSPTLRAYVIFDVDLRSGPTCQAGEPPALQPDSLAGRIPDSARHRALAGAQDHLRQRTGASAANSFRRGRCGQVPGRPSTSRPLLSGDERHVGFVLTTRSAKGVEFASRETGMHGPRLVVEREEDETTSSSTTTTTERRPGRDPLRY